MAGNVKDFAVVGAGPTGLYAAYFAGIRGLQIILFDKAAHTGGKLTALYSKELVYDVSGYPKAEAKVLASDLLAQAQMFEADLLLNTPVQKLERNPHNYWEIITPTHSYSARFVLLACGAGAFLPPTFDTLDDKSLAKIGIYYIIANPNIFRDQRVLFVGSTTVAIEWALAAEVLAKSVHIINLSRRHKVTRDKYHQLFNARIEVRPNYELKTIYGEDRIQAVTIVNDLTGLEETIPVDALVVQVGHLTNLSRLASWGLEFHGNAVKVNNFMETNLPGVFAAGDIAYHSGKLKTISAGAAESAIAVDRCLEISG